VHRGSCLELCYCNMVSFRGPCYIFIEIKTPEAVQNRYILYDLIVQRTLICTVIDNGLLDI